MCPLSLRRKRLIELLVRVALETVAVDVSAILTVIGVSAILTVLAVSAILTVGGVSTILTVGVGVGISTIRTVAAVAAAAAPPRPPLLLLMLLLLLLTVHSVTTSAISLVPAPPSSPRRRVAVATVAGWGHILSNRVHTHHNICKRYTVLDTVRHEMWVRTKQLLISVISHSIHTGYKLQDPTYQKQDTL